MKRLILSLACFGFVANAHAVEVLSSIKPIQLITQEITKDTAESHALVDSNMSPHDYSLKPSDVKKIRSADLIVWYGPDLERFMTSLTEEQKNVLTVSELSNVDLRAFDEGHHDDHHHHHGSYDPHFWLGPKQAGSVAKAVAEKLQAIDPENSAQYQDNLKEFLANLQKTSLEIDAELKPVKDKGYFVFHEAYGYFEDYYELNHLGAFTVSPERKPGAKTLIQIKTRLKEGDVQCVFSEPQFKPAVIETVTRGTGVNQGQLDPLASDIEVKPGAYFDFLRQMSSSFTSCLS
ncbi:zinc ABC transporter substrate-binding protein ZnuA [Vibrio ishigakensis]|uniref:zinc ABC transporter substrate-binding protein ZnuA n=1 Tax=Vibrio ishigakensis TaxID=1481914 RepID=UPI0021C3D6D9|nr:zinc ABC transporter substrate-binding protein ZnuA [Vibrio ishigakensis]